MEAYTIKKLIIISCLLILALPAQGEIITYVDKEGVVHITDQFSDRPLKTPPRPFILPPGPPLSPKDPGIKQEEMTAKKSPPLEMQKKGTVIIKANGTIGSGFLVNPTGYILTNSHVLKENRFVSVQLYDGTIKEAYIVRNFPESDVALIKVPGENLPYLLGSNLFDFKEGEDVYVVGAPQGLDYSVTQGIISGFRKVMVNGKKLVYIQTDAPINRGNSGGPLIRKSDGMVVGLITFKSMGIGVEGLGFALAYPEITKLLNLDLLIRQ